MLDYILYDWQPPPFYRQGPCIVEQTEQGLRCTSRPGTYAHKRMLKKQAEQKQVDAIAYFAFVLAAAFPLGALALHFL